MTPAQLADLIVDVPDHPEPGVVFKDLTPLLADPAGLRGLVDQLATQTEGLAFDVIVGMEARGFVLGAPLAYALGVGFVPARKAGKLPRATRAVHYDLEYGTASLELHVDAVPAGTRVLVVDDVLATGGTAAATLELVRSVGAEVVACHFLMEIGFLAGRDRLGEVPVSALLTV